jgi:hypothetical protein
MTIIVPGSILRVGVSSYNELCKRYSSKWLVLNWIAFNRPSLQHRLQSVCSTDMLASGVHIANESVRVGRPDRTRLLAKFS